MHYYISAFKIFLVECKGICENVTSDRRNPPNQVNYMKSDVYMLQRIFSPSLYFPQFLISSPMGTSL